MKSGFQKVIASLLIAIIMISTTSITVDSAATVGDIKDDYVRSGLDIVKQAASHLGRAYKMDPLVRKLMKRDIIVRE